MSKKLLTRKEVARNLRMGLTALNELLQSGELASCFIGGKRLVAEEDLDAFIESKKNEGVRA